MNAPSEDIKDILEGESALGLTFATDLFISEIPGGVTGQCVCVNDSGGDMPELQYNYERPALQVLVRSARGEYLTGHELAQSIRDVLIGTYNYTINGARYILIKCSSDVLSVGLDDNQRSLFSVNFEIHRTEA